MKDVETSNKLVGRSREQGEERWKSRTRRRKMQFWNKVCHCRFRTAE